jgi:serine/threonine protein kinase
MDWLPAGFTALDRMGDGSFGRVELIKRDSDNALFALKVLEGKSGIDSAEPEIAALEVIDSPFVCKLYEVVRLPTLITMRIDACLGGTLRQRIARARETETVIEIPEILNLFTQILIGLHEIHSKGIVHRDLSPGNLLFVEQTSTSEYGRLQIIDLGVSAFLKDGPLTGTFGTKNYMSPEVANGAAHDTKADIYSIGVILYEMIELKVPAKPGTQECQNHTRLSPFVSRFLSVSPADRPTTEKALRVRDIAAIASTFADAERIVLTTNDYQAVEYEFQEGDLGDLPVLGASGGFDESGRFLAPGHSVWRDEQAMNVADLKEQDRQTQLRAQEQKTSLQAHGTEFKQRVESVKSSSIKREHLANFKDSAAIMPVFTMSDEEKAADDLEKTRSLIEKRIGLQRLLRAYQRLKDDPLLAPSELEITPIDYDQISRLLRRDREVYG